VKRYYSTSDAAEMCQVTTSSILRWIRGGKLKAALTAGGHHRIDGRDLEVFLLGLGLPIPPRLTASNGEASPLKILVVEDDEKMRLFVKKVLQENFPGAVLEEAADGFVAGWKAHQIKPDIILLDILLPGMDGYAFCEKFRNETGLANTHILAMSGSQDPETREKILTAGADDFMAKPFSVVELCAKISKQTAVSKGKKP
jgi:excisionase family DNA binding protein